MHIGEFKQVIDHIRQTLVGGRLTRINAPAPGSVAMTFDLEVPEPVVIASVNPRCSTIFTTDSEPPFYESSKPQRMLNASFVKALEHTCLGFTLTDVKLLRPDDRIALLTFHHTDQYGEEKTRTLQIELTGRVAHMFLLTETGRVVSSMRRLHRPGTREFKEAKRRIAAGKPLPPPPMPPAGREEEPTAPLEEVMMREKDAFAELQNELAGSPKSIGPETENRQAEALRRELALAYQAKSALAVLGPFSLAPSAVREILRGATSEKFVGRLDERGLLDEPIDFNQMISYLQRLAGSADKLEKLVTEAEHRPARKPRHQGAPAKAVKADPVSDKLARFPYKVRRGHTTGGFDLILTFNAEGNLAALKAFASAHNYWFHARDFSGSYVLMLTGKRSPDPHDIEQAAVVAAAHSKGRGESSVEVCYTQLKHLKKPKSAKTGTILRTQETVITVRPSAFEDIRGELFGTSD